MRRDDIGPTCKNCRSSRRWREALRNAYGLPNDDVDFDCPYGRGKVKGKGAEPPERKPYVDSTPRKSRGLGDTVAKLTKAVGIKPCGGCRKRQARLNDLVPYKQKKEDIAG